MNTGAVLIVVGVAVAVAGLAMWSVPLAVTCGGLGLAILGCMVLTGEAIKDAQQSKEKQT